MPGAALARFERVWDGVSVTRMDVHRYGMPYGMSAINALYLKSITLTYFIQAIDLGLNRDGDNWKDSSGRDVWTPIEKQIRKQIWWSCCITDKCVAISHSCYAGF